MKIRSALLFLALLASTLSSKAGSVTNATVNYGDGNVVCYIYTFSQTDQTLELGNDTLPMVQSAAGSVSGYIKTDGDPTLTLGNTINNSTAAAWTGYIIDVNMAQTFTITPVLPLLNPLWSVSSVTQPSPMTGPFNGEIVLDLSAAPVAPGGILSFTYQLTFGGSTSFTETLTPVNVPEPGTFSFLAAGGLLFGGWTATRRRNK